MVLADINAAGLNVTAAMVREAGGTPLIHPTDVARRGDVEALADETLRACGRLDCWINSAGITLWAVVGQATTDAAEQVVAVNMIGSYWGCAAAARVMKGLGQGGRHRQRLVHRRRQPRPAAVCIRDEQGRREPIDTGMCAGNGIGGHQGQCSGFGVIDTPIIESMYRDASGEVDPSLREQIMVQMRSLSPLGLVGRPMDVAIALLYLASDASRFVTGTTLRVSGGV